MHVYILIGINKVPPFPGECSGETGHMAVVCIIPLYFQSSFWVCTQVSLQLSPLLTPIIWEFEIGTQQPKKHI